MRSPTGERLAARGVQHRIEGDHPSLQVEILRQLAHGRDLVGFRADLQLPEVQAAAVLDGGHHHPPFAIEASRTSLPSRATGAPASLNCSIHSRRAVSSASGGMEDRT